MTNLKDLERLLDQATTLTLQRAGQVGQEAAQETTLFHAGTSFQNQIVTYPTSKTNQVIWSQAPYSQYLEYGNNQAGPYIYPSNKKVLHFSINGQDIFARKVKSHGGLPFMDNASKVTQEQLPLIWQAELHHFFKG